MKRFLCICFFRLFVSLHLFLFSFIARSTWSQTTKMMTTTMTTTATIHFYTFDFACTEHRNEYTDMYMYNVHTLLYHFNFDSMHRSSFTLIVLKKKMKKKHTRRLLRKTTTTMPFWRVVLFLTLKIECWNDTVKSIVIIIVDFFTQNCEELKAIYCIESTGKAVGKRESNRIESMSLSAQFAPEIRI